MFLFGAGEVRAVALVRLLFGAGEGTAVAVVRLLFGAGEVTAVAGENYIMRSFIICAHGQAIST
jgi:hypothetical protein